MYAFFADDSAYKGARKGMGRLLGFGGVLVPANALRQLESAVDELARRHGLPSGEEVKWSPRKGTWIYENLKESARVACYREMLAAARDLECKAVVTICDYERRNLKPDWGLQRCVMYSLERVSTYMDNLEDSCIIVSDRPAGGHKEADRFVNSFVEHLSNERSHMTPSSFAINLLAAPSHTIRVLQLADLVVAITTAMFAGRTKYASEYFDIVKSMFIRNALGYIGGTGVKVYPDQLINLYFWVLGEREFSKASRGMAWPIPSPSFLWQESDGIERA